MESYQPDALWLMERQLRSQQGHAGCDLHGATALIACPWMIHMASTLQVKETPVLTDYFHSFNLANRFYEGTNNLRGGVLEIHKLHKSETYSHSEKQININGFCKYLLLNLLVWVNAICTYY